MEIQLKIKQPESRKLEFKEKLPAGKNFLKTITAFANGAGGELILGVSDADRQVNGKFLGKITATSFLRLPAWFCLEKSHWQIMIMPISV